MSPYQNFLPARLAAAIAVITLASIAGCWRGEREVVIGAIGVIGDPAKAPPIDTFGLHLAVEELNQRLEGRYQFRIAQGQDATGLESIARFRDDPAVIGIVGPSGSDQALAARQVFADAEGGGRRAMVALSASAMSPTLGGASPWLFRLTPNGSDASLVVARYLADSLHVRRAAVLYESDAFGRAWTRAFRTAFEATGGTVVMIEPYVDSVAEWATYAAYARHVGAEAIAMPGTADAAIRLFGALKESGGGIPLVATGAVDGLGQRGPEAAGIHYTVRFDPERVTSPLARGFVTRFRQRFKREPNYFAANTYDAVMLYGEAVAAVGPNRPLVRDYIESLGGSRRPLLGTNGPIAFDSLHNTIGRTVQMRTVPANVAVTP